MIAKITPLIRLPQSADSFDYHVPDEMIGKIKIGQLVNIPWRNKKQPGVVLSLEENLGKAKAKFRARPISEILHEIPILSMAQLELIKIFSDYYFCAQGYAARLIVPDPLKRKSKILESYSLQLTAYSFPILKSQLANLERSIASLRGSVLTTAAIQLSTHCALDAGLPRRPEYRTPRNDIIIQDVSSFAWLIFHLMKQSQGQVLALFPTIDLIQAIGSVVQKKCSDKMSVIHSNLSKGKYWSEYQKILSGKARVILSTRQGVFLPIQNKSKIIFFESTSQDFKQYDQHPRYDARIVASWLSEITGSQIIFSSASTRHAELPSAMLRKALRASVSASDRHDKIFLPVASNIKTRIKLIDMKQEMSKKGFSIIADSTFEDIKKAIQKNKKVLIISLREESETGVSVIKLSQILTNALKDCKISIKYDSNEYFDILVTTAYALEALKLTLERAKFGLAVFASIEPLLAIPDFRGKERVFNKLCFWKIMCQELRIPRIILQSYSPENASIRAFAYGEVEQFIKSELEHRKELNYPPFSQLIKLWRKAQLPKFQTTKIPNYQNTASVAQTLKSELGNSATVLGPFKDKKNQESLLIKAKHGADLSVLRSLPVGWVIDRDPENVL